MKIQQIIIRNTTTDSFGLKISYSLGSNTTTDRFGLKISYSLGSNTTTDHFGLNISYSLGFPNQLTTQCGTGRGQLQHQVAMHAVINTSLRPTDQRPTNQRHLTINNILLLLQVLWSLSLPCSVVFLKVRCFQPDAFLAWKHRQRMYVYCTGTLVRSMNGTLYTHKCHTSAHSYTPWMAHCTHTDVTPQHITKTANF